MPSISIEDIIGISLGVVGGVALTEFIKAKQEAEDLKKIKYCCFCGEKLTKEDHKSQNFNGKKEHEKVTKKTYTKRNTKHVLRNVYGHKHSNIRVKKGG